MNITHATNDTQKYYQNIKEKDAQHKARMQGLNILYGVFYIKERNGKLDYYGPIDNILCQDNSKFIHDLAKQYPGSKVSLLPNFYKSKYYGGLYPASSWRN